MINHIVMLKLQDDKQVEAETLKAKLLALPSEIPEIQHYDVGINMIVDDRNYDVILISKFESISTMDDYKAHPKHVEVLNYIKSVISSIAVVDYET